VGSDSSSDGLLADHAFILTDSDSEEELEKAEQAPPTFLESIVQSNLFQGFFSTVIVLNLFVMVVQADWKYDKWPPGCQQRCYHVWHWVNMSFLSLFVAELLLRIAARGWYDFFCKAPDVAWNIFDFGIVFLGVIDTLMRALKLGHRGGNFIAVARILRVMRVLRVVRLLKTFRQLRMLARGLIESVTIVFWIFFLIVFLIFIYAIFFTSIINNRYFDWGEDEDAIREYFGTVPLAMFTLFQFVTLDNWVDVDVIMMKHMPKFMQLAIFSFIIIESFVILSLLTGVMADHMDQVRKDEETDLLKENRMDVNATMEAFKRLFAKPGGKGTAYVTKKEFGQIFADHNLCAQLNADDIEITGMEALEVFDIFDKDCDGVLMWSEFRHGLEEFREGLTTLQLLQLNGIFKRLADKVARNPSGQLPGDTYRRREPSSTAVAELERTEARIMAMDKRLSKFDARVREMMAVYGSRSSYVKKPKIRPRRSSAANSPVPVGSVGSLEGVGDDASPMSPASQRPPEAGATS